MEDISKEGNHVMTEPNSMMTISTKDLANVRAASKQSILSEASKSESEQSVPARRSRSTTFDDVSEVCEFVVEPDMTPTPGRIESYTWSTTTAEQEDVETGLNDFSALAETRRVRNCVTANFGRAVNQVGLTVQSSTLWQRRTANNRGY
jgi:hypothetical protein